jgi:hypothetical protein
LQATQLLYVMQAVHDVKLPPLAGGEGSEDRMVEEFAPGAKLLLAAADDAVHLGDLRANLGQNFLRGNSARTSDGRGFAPRGQIAESDDDQGAASLSPSLGGGEWNFGFHDALESFDGSGVG